MVVLRNWYIEPPISLYFEHNSSLDINLVTLLGYVRNLLLKILKESQMLTVTTFTFSITCTSNFEYRDYSKLNEKKILSNYFCKTFYEIVMQHENSLTQPLPP